LHVRVPDALLTSLVGAAFLAAACSTTQSVPTPVSGMGLGTVSAPSSTSSSPGPWTSPSPSPAPASVTSLTGPMDAALVLCTTALNLEPCGLVTTGVSDMISCYAACQVQIHTVVTFSVERAAIECAAAEPPANDAPRECALDFPPTAAIDLEALGKSCDARCKELADGQPQSSVR
jgi:hypothetical protein